ncbi:MAG: hypothetical protein J5499_01170 [Lachnospiraceae bacterium]|nr:hypothetical protein [Lachnospiraceae bacterium]MBR5368111.1 hypothetical protein [Lachnospiraceae bacterium]
MDWGLWIMIAVVLIMIIGMIVVSRRDGNRAPENEVFDERQKMIRGDGYKWGFVSMICYFMIYAIIISASGHTIGEPELMIFIGLEIGLVVCAVYCILRDALIGVNRSFKFVVFMDAFCLLAQLIGYLRERANGALLIENGKLTSTALPLSIAVSFMIILVALLVRRHYQKREEQNEA